MTIQELVEKLQKWPGETIVCLAAIDEEDGIPYWTEIHGVDEYIQTDDGTVEGQEPCLLHSGIRVMN